MNSDVGILVSTIAAFGLLGGLGIGGAMWLDSAACHSSARVMRMAADWGPLQGCMVEVDRDVWRPMQSFRRVEQ